MKKTLTIALLVLLTIGLFVSCNADAVIDLFPEDNPPVATSYTVTFDLNGVGSSIDSQIVIKDGKVDKPDDPTDTNHIFKGWYKDCEYKTEWNFDTDVVTTDTVIYAKWTRTMGSILATNMDIPRATDESVPANAWVNSANPGCKAYIKTDGKFRVAGPDSGILFGVSEEFVKVGNKYVGDWSSGGYGVLTCYMTDSKFTSANYDGKNTTNYKSLTGTYAPSVPVASVSIEQSSLELPVGEEQTLSAIVLPVNATNKNVTWGSNNTGVATVDTDGKVTAIAAGTATITATTEDGNKTATCTVTVTTPTPTISTIEDVLATVPGGFPTSTNQNIVPENAWHSGTNHFAYVYSTALFIKQPTDEDGSKAGWTPITLNNPVTKDGNSYTYSHTLFNLTFKMEDGILTSIEISGSSGNTKYDGTYVSASPTPATYTVTFEPDEEGGEVHDSNGQKVTEIINVPSGTTFSVSSNEITIGENVYTAVANSGWTFHSFDPGSGTITGATTIKVNFAQDQP